MLIIYTMTLGGEILVMDSIISLLYPSISGKDYGFVDRLGLLVEGPRFGPWPVSGSRFWKRLFFAWNSREALLVSVGKTELDVSAS